MFKKRNLSMFFVTLSVQLDSLVVDLKLVPPPTKKILRALKLRVRACVRVQLCEGERERVIT